jgi:hypothetical protein
MNAKTFFTSSIIWGTLGPVRMYGPTGIYRVTLWGFLVGALLPIPIYLLSKRKYPQLRHIYMPNLLIGGLMWAPFNLTWITPCVYLGYIFQVHIKRRFFSWWSTYNVSFFRSIPLILVHYVFGFDSGGCRRWHNYLFRFGLQRLVSGLVGK